MLNERARDILAFIRRFKNEKGFPPTIREIGSEFAINSTNGVRYYLNLLEKDGHLKRRGKISRGIELEDEDQGSGIPILGQIAAGQPIQAEQSFEGTIDPNQLFGDARGLFALKVRGDSMIEAGVMAGDYVIVRGQQRAEPGEMIVAQIGREDATVKFYRPHADRVELEPANARYEPIVVERGTDFQIVGVVKGVVRTVGR